MLKKRKRLIALIGGSFDPPHAGHKMIAKWVLKKHAPHQVWLLIAKQNPHKENSSPISTRYAWCKKQFCGKKILPSQFEESVSSFYSVDVIKELQKKYHDYRFLFVMGEDNFITIRSWQYYESLPFFAPIAIIRRFPHHKATKKQFLSCKKNYLWKKISVKKSKKWSCMEGYYFHHNPVNAMSSTKIRKSHKQETSIIL